MAGIKISDLPTASTLTGTEQLAIVQSSTTKVVPTSAFSTLIGSGFVSSTDYAVTSGGYTHMQAASAYWEDTSTAFRDLSSDLAFKSSSQTFAGIQTFTEIHTQHIEAGFCVTANGACASVLGGYYNDATGGGSAVVAGNNNDTFGTFSTIAGGQNNTISVVACSGFVAGGEGNVVNHENAVAMGTCTVSVSASMLHVNSLYAHSLPTTDPGVSGVIWNDSGDLKISV
tara:strand:+ start:806 stop:1489 length:684 start_codon:yes stop_codon:yes gene_type:complete